MMMNARLVIFSASLWAGLYALGTAAAPAAPPNFVIILGEAQGWASMSAPLDDRDPEGSRSDFILTPNLDSIAEHGVRFSDFYAASPRCTPTRAALVTGRSPAALHMTFVNEGKRDAQGMPGDKVLPPEGSITELSTDIPTMASLLKRAGYATAHYGKWHLGRVSPAAYGFTENDGPNNNDGPDNVEDPNPKQCYAIAEQGMDFITRQVQARKPFLLQLSQYPGRGPVTAREDTLESVRKRLGTRMDFARIGTAAGNEEIDKTIGLVLAKLRELGVMGNTYIIYTADHGAQGRNVNGALANGKGTVWEGGLRVPLLVAGPSIKPGQFSHVRASTVDLLPTVLELAGIKETPAGLEGVSLVDVLTKDANTPPQRAHEELVIHFPHYDKDPLGPASAIIYQQWKMIRIFETEQRLLYDLGKDISEEHDLSQSNPNVVLALDNRMMDYLRAVGALMPKPNPNYVEGGARSGDTRGGGGGGGKGGKGGNGKGGKKP